MTIHLLLQQTANGLMVGAVYALIALGFTLVFGVAGVVNMAHPDLFMIGGVAAWVVSVPLHLPFLLAIVLGSAVAALVGIVVERVAIRPVASGEVLAPLITTIGASIFIENATSNIFGSQALFFPSFLPTNPVFVGPVRVTELKVIVLIASLAMAAGLLVLINRSRLGRAIRATAENPEVAQILGVDVQLVTVATVAIASALGGAGGALVGQLYNGVYPLMGLDYGIKGLVVMIVGGVGSIEGAVLVGLSLGVMESLTATLWSSAYRDAIAFVLLILFLLFRPSGLFSRVRVERA